METFNLLAEDGGGWDRTNDREGYRHKATVIGERLGAAKLGATLYELDPGEATWPYHYEQGCEEWLLTVSGRPTLRTPDGERELSPGELLAFPDGPAGAHRVVNATGEPARVLILSAKTPLVSVFYPDSGKVGIWSQGNGYEAMLRTEPKLDYWDGE